MPSVNGMGFRDPNTGEYSRVDLRDAIELKQIVHRCQLHIFITPDYRRVYVVGGEYPIYDHAYVREADRVEIEALAERFDSPELRRVLASVNR